jgi:hypothetical protein
MGAALHRLRVSSRVGETLIEWSLSAAVVASVGLLVLFFRAHGYLPSPFYHPDLTFMDWFDTAWWARRTDAYEHWRTVYPPLSLLIVQHIGPARCYGSSPLGARDCDQAAPWLLIALALLSAALAFLAFRKVRPAAAAARTIAFAGGASMLYALDRGNLILMTLPPFILAFGGLVRSRWGRALAVALTLNFKPYLGLAMLAWVQRSRWTMLAAITAAAVGVYLATWAAYGAGDPLRMASDLSGAGRFPHTAGFDLMSFSSTYESILAVVRTRGPVAQLLGPAGVIALEVLTPLAILSAMSCAWLCILTSWHRPGGLSEARVAAHALAIFLSIGCPGGYSVLFLLFLVFLEPWRGAGRVVALICAYLWCVPLDAPLRIVGRETVTSFLAHRTVTREVAITLGQFLRPALLFGMEWGLIAASWRDLRGAPPDTSVAAAKTSGAVRERVLA